jgi:hypothetical protein
LQRDPNHPRLNNNLAWVLATASRAEYRNGEEALTRARLANEATRGRDPGVLDTLAAAYAEVGRFEDAAQVAAEAVAIARSAGQIALARGIEAHLAEYRAGRPHREP